MKWTRPLDEIDRQILCLHRQDGRRTITDIAASVRLSPAPVKRRIARLRHHGDPVGTKTRIVLDDQQQLHGGVRLPGHVGELVLQTAVGGLEVFAQQIRVVVVHPAMSDSNRLAGPKREHSRAGQRDRPVRF